MEYNVYCDESCHLENDGSNVMVIGGVYCSKEKIKDVNRRITEIKNKYGVRKLSEIKWTKISELKEQMYLDIVDYFFDDDDLHFRCILADKSNLRHEKYNQTHDDWYYKMYFTMLKVIFTPNDKYNVYIDIKDTHSHEKAKKLLDVCRNSKYDFSGRIIRKIQPIRSNEVQIMQLSDILIGAICYANRFDLSSSEINVGKLHIINRVKQRSNYSLTRSTLYKETKLNIFKWEANHGENY
ncbi:putative uncharacterized protein [Amedibacillus dolichus CAG:375]|uniref:DUF3800 domain-containing protein n=1 Tax=Amedibacillus dolichus CAG:375 TaxID=1263076 RepID=R7G799_9FIRM|nr:DUF3800 domain-containing protein [Amedibacillus dolichus]CDE23025.1 putative uncharacterized protein [Amedibacillus dolichus CAG:375]